MSFWTELKRAFSRDTPAFKDRPTLTPDTAIDIVRSTGNRALAREMQRGRNRASSRAAEEAHYTLSQPPGSNTAATKREDGEALHAHELSPNDAAFIAMVTGAGCTFGGGLTLPSGRFVTGEEMYRWVGPPGGNF